MPFHFALPSPFNNPINKTFILCVCERERETIEMDPPQVETMDISSKSYPPIEDEQDKIVDQW